MSLSLLTPTRVPDTASELPENIAELAIDSAKPSLLEQLACLNANIRSTSPYCSQDNPLRYLQVSPYAESEHLLDLSSLDIAHRLFALALTTLEPSVADYASAQYSNAFNWANVFTLLKALSDTESFRYPQTEFYVVQFRSKLKEHIDKELLFRLDKESHREATAAGGLLKYWFGSPDNERRNLATCLWRNKEDAAAGGKGPWHKQARSIISKTYEHIDVSGLRLVIDEDVESWRFESFAYN